MGFFQDGELFISGRLKDVIIIRGRNYYPHDLEAAAAEVCPELDGQVEAAFAVEDEAGPRVVIVQEVPRDYQPGKGEELFARIRESLAQFFELELHKLLLVKTGTIPRSSSGKVQHRECARRMQAGELAVIEESSALVVGQDADPDMAGHNHRIGILCHEGQDRTPDPGTARVRDWLVARLARHLKVPESQIDLHRPFAGYGLDSLAMLSLAGDLQQWLGRPLPPTLLYSAPTIASLAQALTRQASLEYDPQDEQNLSNPAQLPIAVVGIGCRFPGAAGPEQFWHLLTTGTYAVGELPPGRWDHIPDALATTRGGYLDEVQCFDAPFFGIAPREAVFIDPQHRMMLEVAWEALEHAGIRPDRLAGRSVGAFVGISTNDYGRLLLAHGSAADAYAGVGNSPSMAAHRLSYHLDLRGPSVAVDTACSSSLVAVHLACQKSAQRRVRTGPGGRRQPDPHPGIDRSAVPGGDALAGWKVQDL